jgi:hypothetical protein
VQQLALVHTLTDLSAVPATFFTWILSGSSHKEPLRHGMTWSSHWLEP